MQSKNICFVKFLFYDTKLTREDEEEMSAIGKKLSS